MQNVMPMVGAIKRHSDAVDGSVFRSPVHKSSSHKAGEPLANGTPLKTPEPKLSEGDDGQSSATNKRKRQSVGGSTPAGLPSSATKKRVRTSIVGTPGKATPMDVGRERDVEKRFLELEVTEVYKAIRKQTGALGGNAAGGAIYGEITQNSFQRVVDYMKEHCELSKASLFLDVGSGLGKPNMHVAIDPGVEVSYGVELEELRWHLSLHNLKSVLELEINKNKACRTIFTAGDITDAKSLNPFSHIYSFDVGFPPDVMEHMARTFNRSRARYFISFHVPRKVIDVYGFKVENIGRVATSMAGSSEGHTCYFYRSTRPVQTSSDRAVEKDELVHVDPLFRPGFDILSRDKDGVLAWIIAFFGEEHGNGRTRRQKRSRQTSQLQQRPLESYYRIVGKARLLDDHLKK